MSPISRSLSLYSLLIQIFSSSAFFTLDIVTSYFYNRTSILTLLASDQVVISIYVLCTREQKGFCRCFFEGSRLFGLCYQTHPPSDTSRAQVYVSLLSVSFSAWILIFFFFFILEQNFLNCIFLPEDIWRIIITLFHVHDVVNSKCPDCYGHWFYFRRDLPIDLTEGVLRALCLQALGQVFSLFSICSYFLYCSFCYFTLGTGIPVVD